MTTAPVADTLHQSQLLKGVLSVLLLQLLAERESYGYELVVRIHQAGLTGVAEGTVYPALARLDREAKVTSRLVPSTSGPARKYYRLTPTGYHALATGIAAWQRLVDVVSPLLSQPIPPQPAAPEGS
jgi:PadR family transcriptional regulator, regulatory protein PadR